MTEFWVSQARPWCEYCRIYISPGNVPKKLHEQGDKHKKNVQIYLANLHKKNQLKAREDKELESEIMRIKQAGTHAYISKDLANEDVRDQMREKAVAAAAAAHSHGSAPNFRAPPDAGTYAEVNQQKKVAKPMSPIMSSQEYCAQYVEYEKDKKAKQQQYAQYYAQYAQYPQK